MQCSMRYFPLDLSPTCAVLPSTVGCRQGDVARDPNWLASKWILFTQTQLIYVSTNVDQQDGFDEQGR